MAFALCAQDGQEIFCYGRERSWVPDGAEAASNHWHERFHHHPWKAQALHQARCARHAEAGGDHPVPWLDLTFAADTVFNGQAPVASARYARTTQLVLTPALGFHLRGAWQLRAEFVLPVAGALGSHAYAGSLGLGLER